MGGSSANVRAAQRPYLRSRGDLPKHQETCTQVAVMRYEYQKQIVMAVKKDIEDEQHIAITEALDL